MLSTVDRHAWEKEPLMCEMLTGPSRFSQLPLLSFPQRSLTLQEKLTFQLVGDSLQVLFP